MRWVMVAAAVATGALVLFGGLTTPGFFNGGQGSWLGLAAVLAVLFAYGAAGASGMPVAERAGVLAVAAPAGFAAGGVYAAEIVLEYLVQPTDNTPWGLAEFGAVFALMAIAGGVLGWRTRRLRPALAGGLWTGMIASLIWYGVLLAVFYLFRGTAAQAAVFRAEGDYEDFARSGIGDFKVFAMQDFLGAGVFHLLLSPLFGLVLGGLGGGLARLAAGRRWVVSTGKS